MDLDPQQEAAVRATPRSWLRIDAGPGAGKTEVLARRAAWLLCEGHFAPSEIVLLTYTRSMAADLRRRVAAALPPDLVCPACCGAGRVGGGTCSACLGTQRQGIGELAVGTLHALAGRWVRAVAAGELAGTAAVIAAGWLSDDAPARFGFALPEDVEDLTRHAQALVGKKRITQRALADGLRLHGEALAGCPPEAELRRQLRIRGLITYDDVLALLATALHHPVGGATLTSRHPCLLLDERQDLTAEHWGLVQAWAPASLTAVGDSAQAVFGFLRGRDGRDGTHIPFAATVTTAVNYRSGTAIVGLANEVRAALANDGACAALVQTPARAEAGVVWRRAPVDEAALARDAADCVAAWIDAGVAAEDIAVIAATWEELFDVGYELEDIGIPAATPARGARRLWQTVAGRAVVAVARMADRGSADRHDMLLLLRALGLPEAQLDTAYATAFERGVSVEAVLDALWGQSITACGSMTQVADLITHVPGADKARAAVALWLRRWRRGHAGGVARVARDRGRRGPRISRRRRAAPDRARRKGAAVARGCGPGRQRGRLPPPLGEGRGGGPRVGALPLRGMFEGEGRPRRIVPPQLAGQGQAGSQMAAEE